MFLSEQIKASAPGNANYYRLKLSMTDGAERLFPADPGVFLKIGESPVGVPNGEYVLCFYDDEGRPISHPEKKILIELQAATSATSGQLNLHLLNAQGPSKPGLHAKLGRVEERRSTAQVAASPSSSDETAPTDEIDREFRRHLQAMDLEERQQEFIKNSTYVTEVAELFTVNRLMRREMLELHRIIIQHSARAYQDIDHVKGTIHELLALQKSVLEHAAAQIAKPPAPPPDYVGLGHSALSVVKEIGVALVQRSHGRSAGGKIAEKSSSPQLAPPAEVSAAPAGGQSEILSRLMEKLQGLTELDLAAAMSSPESWKALLDELRTGGNPAADKDADRSTPNKE